MNTQQQSALYRHARRWFQKELAKRYPDKVKAPADIDEKIRRADVKFRSTMSDDEWETFLSDCRVVEKELRAKVRRLRAEEARVEVAA